MKWTGPAQWLKREARAGDRLPFERHIDEATIRLRDGALMRTLQIGGLEFETADCDQLHHAQQVREVHLLMNNCYQDYGVRNAADLQQLLLDAG